MIFFLIQFLFLTQLHDTVFYIVQNKPLFLYPFLPLEVHSSQLTSHSLQRESMEQMLKCIHPFFFTTGLHQLYPMKREKDFFASVLLHLSYLMWINQPFGLKHSSIGYFHLLVLSRDLSRVVDLVCRLRTHAQIYARTQPSIHSD